MANAAGTNVPGAMLRSARELANTSRMDTTAVTITINGRVVTSRWARYSASRVALPAMNWALTAPEQIIAVSTEESTAGREDAIKRLWAARVGAPGGPDVRSSYHPVMGRLGFGLPEAGDNGAHVE